MSRRRIHEGLPLPAFLSAVAIGLMALVELFKNKPLDLGHGMDVE